jgi:Tfp pilus assembly protein PilF
VGTADFEIQCLDEEHLLALIAESPGMNKLVRLNMVCARKAGLLLVIGLFAAGCATGQPSDNNKSSDKAGKISEKAGFIIKDKVAADADARADFDRAVRYLREENYEKAIEILKKAADRSPGSTALYINLAIAYQKTGRPELAEENLKKALAINPDHPLANNEYGLLYRKTGRFADARKAYEHTLAKYPAYLPARKNLAILCDLYLKDLGCALKNYQIYSTAVPDDKTVKIWIADLEKRIAQ